MAGDVGAATKEIEIVGGWEQQLSSHSDEVCIRNAVGKAKLAMEIANLHAPAYTKDDLTIVRRDGSKNVEIWAARDFKKGDLL